MNFHNPSPLLLAGSELQIVNPLQYPEWDEMLLSLPGHSFFHTSYWAKVLHDSYGYVPRYFARIRDRKLSALIPIMEVNSFLTGSRGVSLPFTDYCEPIIPEDVSWTDTLNALIEYGERAGWQSLEIREGGKLLNGRTALSFYYGHSLDLTEKEGVLYSKLKDNTRRNVKKALREGVSIIITDSADGMKEFYRLNCLTRKLHGLPPQPYHFFQNVHDHIIGRGHGFIALAAHENRVIAGAVYFHFGSGVIYKYGASDRRYQHLRPNHLVMWEAISLSCKRGYSSFCFGRTEPQNEGLRSFKQGWGAKERTIQYAKYDIKKKQFIEENSGVSRITAGFFRTAPLALSKFIGKVLYRHVG